MLQVIVVEHASSTGATSFTDLTLLSNDIPTATSCEDELQLHISDEDEDMLGQSIILSLICAGTLSLQQTSDIIKLTWLHQNIRWSLKENL